MAETDVAAALRSGPESEAELRELAQAAAHAPTSELLHLLRTSSAAQASVLFRLLDKNTALELFEDLEPGDQADLIRALRGDDIAHLIDELDPDDRASLFDELPASVADRLLQGLDPAERQMTSTVLGYPRDSIGRYMSPEVLPINQDLTAGQAFQRVRADRRPGDDIPAAHRQR